MGQHLLKEAFLKALPQHIRAEIVHTAVPTNTDTHTPVWTPLCHDVRASKEPLLLKKKITFSKMSNTRTLNIFIL